MHPFYMKTYRFIGLFIGLLAGAGGGFVPKAMAQVELVPNSIQGTVRFSNVNPDILALLNPPGNEGMSYLYMYASSLPPATRSASTDYLTPSTRTDSVYEIAVDSDGRVRQRRNREPAKHRPHHRRWWNVAARELGVWRSQ